LGKPTGLRKIFPLKEEHDLVWILGGAEEIASLTTILPTSGAVFIENRLSCLVVLNPVADE
jgi:hypothetical protein